MVENKSAAVIWDNRFVLKTKKHEQRYGIICRTKQVKILRYRNSTNDQRCERTLADECAL